MKKNKVKPTKLQKETFKHLKGSGSLGEAMVKAGYKKSTATHPKQNFIDAPGTQQLFEEFKNDLRAVGVTTEVLAKVQAKGLVDPDSRVRLEYLKENKKDLFGSREDNDNLKRRIVAEEFFND